MPRKPLDPLARDRARDAGELHYSGSICAKSHDGRRFVSTGRCVECTTEADKARRESWRKSENAPRVTGAGIKRSKVDVSAHKAAQRAGERSFRGDPCQNGHDGTRYTSSRSCVMCSRKNPLRQIAKARSEDHAAPSSDQHPDVRPWSTFISPPTKAQLMAGR